MYRVDLSMFHPFNFLGRRVSVLNFIAAKANILPCLDLAGYHGGGLGVLGICIVVRSRILLIQDRIGMVISVWLTSEYCLY